MSYYGLPLSCTTAAAVTTCVSEPANFVVGQAVSLSPIVSGIVSSYTISPALPSTLGLTLDSSTGVLSGTPTKLASPVTYTITAANAGGTAKTTLRLGVLVAPETPATITYGSQIKYTFAVGQSVLLSPTVNPGDVTGLSFAIKPALPAGLSIDALTGTISGAATRAILPSASTYTITAQNAGGSASVEIDLLFVALPSALSAARLSSGAYEISFQGTPGADYDVQATTDFSSWTTLGTVTADSAGVCSLVDTSAIRYADRFYRARVSNQ